MKNGSMKELNNLTFLCESQKMLNLDRQSRVFSEKINITWLSLNLLSITSSYIIPLWYWFYELERKNANQEVGKAHEHHPRNKNLNKRVGWRCF